MQLIIRPFYKLYISLLAFAVVVIVGVVGYVLIEDYTMLQALYMTVITLATVGYSEVKPLSDAGRIFTILLILSNIGIFTYFIAQTSAYFLDGEFSRTYKIYKMQHSISQLNAHTIICGFGRNGREAARLFLNDKKEFVVIENISNSKSDWPFEVKHYLQDDATRDETLLEAGIASAKALITTLPEDADNLFVVLTARELNPKLKIISRASNDTSVRKLKTAGADYVIMPDKIGGAHMASLVLNTDTKDFLDVFSTQRNDNFKIEDIKANRNISVGDLDCWKQTGATLLGVREENGEYVVNPAPTQQIKKGNLITVIGNAEQLSKISKLLNLKD